MSAASDIRFDDPVERRRWPEKDEERPCLADLLHVHVYPDSVGINVMPHGDVISLGLWRFTAEIPSGTRVRPGPLYFWRTRRAIDRLDREVRRLKDRHASIAKVADLVRQAE